MTIAATKNVRVKDDDGKEHVYIIKLMSATDGFPIYETIVKTFGAAGGDLLDAVKLVMGAPQGDIGSVVQYLDGGKIGASIGKIIDTIREDCGKDFYPDLIARVSRDGQDMSSRAIFDSAYMGNYGELTRAVLQVLNANFGKAILGPFGQILGPFLKAIQEEVTKLPELDELGLAALSTGESGT